MEIPIPSGVDLKLAEIKQIEFSGKGALRAAGAFGDGLDDSVLVGTPVHDQAGLREGSPSDEGAVSFHGKNRLYP
jgi:hypothetical protein